MPEIHAHTPREDYTIAGETFSIAQPFKEGHVLKANEAGSLNQTFAENIRNNFASKVNEAKETGSFDKEVFQSKLDEYMSEYEFGVRTGGGRTGDPVMREAMDLARDAVRSALKAKNISLKEVTSAQITQLAKDALASGRNQHIIDKARERVESARSIAGIELDSLGSSEDAAEPKAHRGKREAA